MAMRMADSTETTVKNIARFPELLQEVTDGDTGSVMSVGGSSDSSAATTGETSGETSGTITEEQTSDGRLAVMRRFETTRDVRNFAVNGGQLDTTDVFGLTPLMHAAAEGAHNVAAALIEYGASICQQDVVGFTPVHWVVCDLMLHPTQQKVETLEVMLRSVPRDVSQSACRALTIKSPHTKTPEPGQRTALQVLVEDNILVYYQYFEEADGAADDLQYMYGTCQPWRSFRQASTALIDAGSSLQKTDDDGQTLEEKLQNMRRAAGDREFGMVVDTCDAIFSAAQRE